MIPATEIKAVFFDFDGTLTRPGGIDFRQMRRAIGCPAGMPILEFIDGIEPSEAREAARCTLQEMELTFAARSSSNHDVEITLNGMQSLGMKMAIISRNCYAAIAASLEGFPGIDLSDFQVIVSRDDSLAPKPSAEGILYAADRIGIAPEQVLFVGDYHFDVTAGKAAGTVTVYLANNRPLPAFETQPDFVVESLSELLDILKSENSRNK